MQDLTVPLPQTTATKVKHKNPPKPQKRKQTDTPHTETKKRKLDKENSKQKPPKTESKSKKADETPKKSGRGKPGPKPGTSTTKKNTKCAPTNDQTTTVCAKDSGSVSKPDITISCLESIQIKQEPGLDIADETATVLCKFNSLNNNVSESRTRLESDNIDSGISDSQADSDRSTDGRDTETAEPTEIAAKDCGNDVKRVDKTLVVLTPSGKANNSVQKLLSSGAKSSIDKQTTPKISKSKAPAQKSKKTPRQKKVTCRSGVRKRLSPAQQIRLKKLKQSPPGVRSLKKKSPLRVQLGILRGKEARKSAKGKDANLKDNKVTDHSKKVVKPKFLEAKSVDTGQKA